MKFFSFTLFLIISGQLLFSQEKKISEVIYRVQNNIIISDSTKQSVNDFVNDLSDEMKNIEFSLYFNSQESSFYEQKKLSSDHNKNSLSNNNIGQIMSFTGNLYTNKSGGYMLHEKTVSTNKFIIKSFTNDLKWEKTNEVKEISGYVCYKAKTLDSIVTIRGTRVFEVTAWYAPKLPYSFGPSGYSGLPGLILELKTNKVIFYAALISLNKHSNINLIQIPTKGKMVTKEEFQNFEKQSFEKYKAYIKN